jgi:hypothetical protein
MTCPEPALSLLRACRNRHSEPHTGLLGNIAELWNVFIVTHLSRTFVRVSSWLASPNVGSSAFEQPSNRSSLERKGPPPNRDQQGPEKAHEKHIRSVVAPPWATLGRFTMGIVAQLWRKKMPVPPNRLRPWARIRGVGFRLRMEPTRLKNVIPISMPALRQRVGLPTLFQGR